MANQRYEPWVLAEVTSSEYDAQVAAHDYAHEGWYFRIRRSSEYTWDIYVRWGRRVFPACCRGVKRRWVDEPVTGVYQPHLPTREQVYGVR